MNKSELVEKIAKGADISKAAELLGYVPSHRILKGIGETMPWYIKRFKNDYYSH